ncbi:MAG: SIMPL domain-containing protein [Ruminiclostridium sp.]
MNRSITVTGTASIKAKPDSTRFEFTLSGRLESCAAAFSQAEEKSSNAKKGVTAAGFNEQSLKTASFSVEPEYENSRDPQTGTYINKLVGYRYSHTLFVEYKLDNNLTGALADALGASGAEPQSIRISFFAENKEELSDKLIEEAVKDATRKAMVIAAASGSQLGEIMEIRYSSADNENAFAAGAAVNLREARCFSAIDFSPAEITETDTVTVTWALF